MEKTSGSIEVGDTQDFLFTYSEEEKQSIEIAKTNSKKIFTPEFIPYYLKDVKILKLTHTESIVYGFIRFYLSNVNERFYFSSEDLSKILDTSIGTIDNIFSKFSKMGIINIGRKVKAGGGTIRFIKKFIGIPTSSASEVGRISDLISQGGLTSSASEVHIKENKINNNKSVSPVSSFADAHELTEETIVCGENLKNDISYQSQSKHIVDIDKGNDIHLLERRASESKRNEVRAREEKWLAELERLLGFWNEEFKRNFKLTNELKKVYFNLRNKYSIDDLRLGVKNYCEFVNNNKWHTHRFSLFDFLKQSNGFIKYYNQ